MKKRVFPRVLWILLLYCTVFIFLGSIQFARRGNFSIKIADMIVSGRYLITEDSAEKKDDFQYLDGGAGIFFGGLDFRLISLPDSNSGMTYTNTGGELFHAAPDFFTVLDNEVIFYFSGGMEISFASVSSKNEFPEIQINGKFPSGISAVEIPFRPQRSSVIRENVADIPVISYNGSRYGFNRNLQSLADGRIILLPAVSSISYRVVPDKKEINPADFILQQAQTMQAFNEAVSAWTSRNFDIWSRRINSNFDEDMVIAWCAESARRGSYRNAVSVVPVQFSTDPGRTWESSVFQIDRRTGVWERAVRNISIYENEKESRISRLIEEKSKALFEEENAIEFLAVRNINRIIDNLLVYLNEFNPADLVLEMSPGILEFCIDVAKWRPGTNNSFNALTDQITILVAEALQETPNGIFVFRENIADTAFNLRLGINLHKWGELFDKPDWAGVGRSIVLSVLALCDENALAPAMLPESNTGRISSAKMYRMLGMNDNLPQARATGTSGVWAWTASSSVNVTQNERQMDIQVRFPAGETHYVMLKNIRPFALFQIYEQNWRSASDFESYYDSSGWFYFAGTNSLVIKIRHRTEVENIRIIFTAPRPPPPPPPPPQPVVETPPVEEPPQTPES